MPATPFDALVTALKRHPLLRDVRTWRAREGPVPDPAPVKSQCPWVRLTCYALPAEPHTYATEARYLRVAVETAVSGSDGAAASRLGRALHAALFDRRDPATRKLWEDVRAAGGSGLLTGEPFAPARAEDFGEALTQASGSFTIQVYSRNR